MHAQGMNAAREVRAIGVSNFDAPLLAALIAEARIPPAYVQNKYSIYQPGNFNVQSPSLRILHLSDFVKIEI